MTKEEFSREYAPLLPNAPGIYRYYNASKKIIYVGKAIDIRKRVSSYFLKQDHNGKTRALVQEIAHIEYTITENEHDAFLLENSLIKHFKPRYNIALKDDKSYPYVVIKNEDFPRLYLTRRLLKDGSEYLGPFTDVATVRQLLQLIKRSIPLRTCNLALTPENIAKKKFKVCLEYHLGNCKGPCEGKQSKEDYDENIRTARKLLKGNLGALIKELKTKMEEAAASLNFEYAAQLKQQTEQFKSYQTQSTVVNTKLGNVDAATLIDSEHHAFVNYLVVQNGLVLHSKNITIEKKLDETPREILSFAVSTLRPMLHSDSPEILVPFEIDLEENDLIQTIPIIGDKRKVLDLSFKNAQYQKEEFEKKERLLLKDKTEEERMEVLRQIQEALHLSKLPRHIECFDNSNFQGSFPVAAMVCFKDGLPFKKEYRHFHIKMVQGINDFASMEEIVYRRYKSVIEEDKPLPDLIIIDGGKGQLSSAMKSIEALGLAGKVAVVGLAKREELIFFPGDSEPLQLDYNGKPMLLIRRIRDEVHRFGITFHRKTRSKGTIKNELEDINGIGKKTAEQLLLAFRSVAKVREASLQELEKTIGRGKAKIVYQYFHPDQKLPNEEL